MTSEETKRRGATGRVCAFSAASPAACSTSPTLPPHYAVMATRDEKAEEAREALRSRWLVSVSGHFQLTGRRSSSPRDLDAAQHRPGPRAARSMCQDV